MAARVRVHRRGRGGGAAGPRGTDRGGRVGRRVADGDLPKELERARPALGRAHGELVPAEIHLLDRLWIVQIGVETSRLTDDEVDLHRSDDLVGELLGPGEQVRRLQ